MESFRTVDTAPVEEVPASVEMKVSVREVERIIRHSFTNKKLLEQALTHSSSSSSSSGSTDSPSYERLEFFGDAIISFAISNYFFFTYPQEPQLTAGELTWLRSAHVQNDKLARVAVQRGLHDHVRRNDASLDHQVIEFAAAVLNEEEDEVLYNGLVEAPKILADIVESIAAAVYIDLNGDLEKLWPILKGLLKPRVNIIEEIRKLHEICQKLHSKQVEIKHTRDIGSKFTASVYVDGQFVALASSNKSETARLNAATLALSKLPQSTPAAADDNGLFQNVAGIDEGIEIEGAKQKLNVLCQKKKWIQPIYKIEEELGPPHKRIFISSVVLVTADRMIFIRGDGKPRRKDSENSAASLMINYPQEPSYFVASASSDKLETARLNAATLALSKLPQSTTAAADDDDGLFENVSGTDGGFEIEGAKQKLNELCKKKKWTEPIYKIEEELGPPHERIFISSVVLATADHMISIRGDGKPRRKDSENSAASLMIHYLQEPSYKPLDVQNSGMFAHPLSTKLNENNFRQWHQQALAALKGNRMLAYIHDRDCMPAEFLTETDRDEGLRLINNAYITWTQHERILMFWLLESMTHNIQTQMVGCKTAFQVWDRIERLFSSQSQARKMQHKLQLQTIKKGGLRMTEYLLKIKNVTDALASEGQVVSEEDQILHILSGLGKEYDAFAISLTTRTEPARLADVCSMLLAQEYRIDQRNVVTEDSLQVNISTNKNISQSKLHAPSGANPLNQGSPQHGGRGNYRGDNAVPHYGGRGSYRGHGRGNRGFRDNPSK